MSVSPELYAQVHPLVAERQRLKAEIDTAETRIDEINNELGSTFVMHGLSKARIGDWNVNIGEGSRTWTDDQLLLENGVDSDVIQRSKRTTTFARVDVRKAGAKS